MSESITPSPWEKQSSKFILDAMQNYAPTEEITETIIEITRAPEPFNWEEYTFIELPKDKKYYRMAEVHELLQVDPAILRSWEENFPALKPNKSGQAQHRVYQRQDVELMAAIKHLTIEKGLSIEIAKQALAQYKRTSVQVSSVPLRNIIHDLKELITFARRASCGI